MTTLAVFFSICLSAWCLHDFFVYYKKERYFIASLALVFAIAFLMCMICAILIEAGIVMF